MDAAGGMNSCWPFQEHILQLTKLLLIFLPENLGGLTARHVPHAAVHCRAMPGPCCRGLAALVVTHRWRWTIPRCNCRSGYPKAELLL